MTQRHKVGLNIILFTFMLMETIKLLPDKVLLFMWIVSKSSH